MTGDVFGSLRCDCGPQLHKALDMINKEGKGVLLYLRQEGRGIGLVNKIKAYALQEKGMDTVEANTHLGFKPDQRDYGIGAQILRALNVKKMKLMTNNPSKRVGLKGYGLEVVEQVPLETKPSKENLKYLKTKKEKMGHTFSEFSDDSLLN
jgi:3,4-dihydroxy 2-butanone 4-phosphate synthase/GTP cyclohydrolase II